MHHKSIFRIFTVFALVIVVTGASLVSVNPAQAASATVSRFYATCSSFSVDLSVSGATNDGGGFDRLRYVVADGNGTLLYQEDSVRQVNVTGEAFVINLAYHANNQPTRNPITFTVIDLDTFSQPIGTLQKMTYDAPCLIPSGAKLAPDDFSTLPNVKGKTIATTTLYYGPGTDMATGLTAAEGSELSAIYRSADSQWIGVLVSTKHMVWVPTKSFSVDPFILPIQPVRIDPSQNVTGAVVPSVPVANGRLLYTLRLRAGPTTTSRIVGAVRYNATVPVFGRSADGNWIAIGYRNLRGWVAARYVRLLDNVDRLSLPVIG